MSLNKMSHIYSAFLKFFPRFQNYLTLKNLPTNSPRIFNFYITERVVWCGKSIYQSVNPSFFSGTQPVFDIYPINSCQHFSMGIYIQFKSRRKTQTVNKKIYNIYNTLNTLTFLPCRIVNNQSRSCICAIFYFIGMHPKMGTYGSFHIFSHQF